MTKKWIINWLTQEKAYSDCIKCNETKAVTILIVNFYV